jgi:molybdopterin-guanine dinucleotide biosynthesis protein A
MSGAQAGRRGTLATIAAALLTGGASSRMARDKAHVEIDGVPAATRICHLLADLFEDVVIVGGEASRRPSAPPPASAWWWWRPICPS